MLIVQALLICRVVLYLGISGALKLPVTNQYIKLFIEDN